MKSLRPNILLAISDDQGWPYAGAYGAKFIRSSAFDWIAEEGILFNHGYCPAPQCAPSRAAILTGKNIWQNQEAATHNGDFPSHLKVYPDLLEKAGYHIGYTGKPWGPGKWENGGRTSNPAGHEYNSCRLEPPTMGISPIDYTANFEEFIRQRPEGKPFCFWFGCREPHRPLELGSGVKEGKSLDEAEIPEFLPDVKEIRNDILDYALEIEWFDQHLSKMIDKLRKIGELDKTIIVVTSDNGMPFPRAKANNYEHGIHVPLAIYWKEGMKGGRVVDDFVSLIDLAPTFLEAAGLTPPEEMTGKSLINLFNSDKSGYIESNRDCVVTGMERHSVARIGDIGYPMRAIRTKEYLYIVNYAPERWPAGNPELYYDIDDSPTKQYMMDHREDAGIQNLFQLAFGKRPPEELYAVKGTRVSIDNIASDPAYAETKKMLRTRLEKILTEQKDPRMEGNGHVFDAYPHHADMDRLKLLKE